jgi:hypothetical protein
MLGWRYRGFVNDDGVGSSLSKTPSNSIVFDGTMSLNFQARYQVSGSIHGFHLGIVDALRGF